MLPAQMSDHKATSITIAFTYEINPSFERTIWLYNKANYESFNDKLETHDWNCLSEGTINEACDVFTETFTKYAKESIPQKNITVRTDDQPWFDSALRKHCKIRKRLKNIAVKSKKPYDWDGYKRARNKVKQHEETS